MFPVLPFLLLSYAPLLARGYVPATASSSQPTGNATLQGKWTTSEGSGVFGGQLVTLVQGDGSGVVASNTTASYGIITNLNETSAVLMNRTVVPFFALVNCDSNSSAPLPLVSSSPSAANATLTNSTTIESNSTSKAVMNTTTLDVFSLAARLGAQGVILYSSLKESCVLNDAYINGNTSKPVPIYTSPTLDFSKVIMQQLANVNSTNTIFNSTLLNAAYASLNLSSTPTATTFSSALVDYLVGTIAYLNSSASTNQSSSPTYATVGHAPSSTATGTVGGAGGKSGAESGKRMSVGVVLLAGFMALWV
ncbi:hypothetical protein RQP46_000986 [Phenoliferia psychrophenolica]